MGAPLPRPWGPQGCNRSRSVSRQIAAELTSRQRVLGIADPASSTMLCAECFNLQPLVIGVLYVN